MQSTVSFLSARVSSSAVDGYNKLRRLIHYIIRSIYLVLYLGVEDISILINFMDAAHSINEDMKS